MKVEDGDSAVLFYSKKDGVTCRCPDVDLMLLDDIRHIDQLSKKEKKKGEDIESE
jgi:hypothetical protein